MEILRHQPRGPAALQKTGLGAVLAASINPAQFQSEVLNQPIVPSSGVTRVPGRHGLAFQHSASNGTVAFGASGGLNTLVAPGTAFSIFLRVWVANTSTRQCLIGDNNGSGGAESFWLETTTTGQWLFRATDSGSQPRAATSAAGVATVGWHDVLMVHRPGIGNQLYVDGVSVATVAFTDNLRAGVSLRVGGFGAYGVLGFMGRTACCHIFREDVSEQLRQLIDNPWHLWTALEDEEDFLAAAGGAGQSFTYVAVGGFALAGAATQARTRAVAGGGGVQLSGAASVIASAAAQLLVVVAAGGIAFSGVAQRVGTAIRAAAGSITFAGSAGYTNSGVVARAVAILRRRTRPRQPVSRR